MLAMPMSSPQITRIFGLRPGEAAGRCGCCAWATWIRSTVWMAVAAAMVVPANSRLRRLSALCFVACLPCFLFGVSPAFLAPFLRRTDKSTRDWIPPHAAKPEMAGRSIDGLRMSCRRPVATAIIRRAQMRAAFQNFPRNADVGLTWIKTGALRPATRILGDAACLRRIGFVLLRPPVGCPFPDIADHVVDAIAVRRKRRHRRGALVAIRVQVLCWKFALPGIGRCMPPGVNSSPQANSAPSSPPRAANSHSASVGRSLPAHRA